MLRSVELREVEGGRAFRCHFPEEQMREAYKNG
jgi:hypothetical protein